MKSLSLLFIVPLWSLFWLRSPKKSKVGKTDPQSPKAFRWYLRPTGMNRENAAKRGVQASEVLCNHKENGISAELIRKGE